MSGGIGGDGKVREVDVVKRIGKRLQGLFADIGFEQTLPDGDTMPSHTCKTMLDVNVSLLIATDLVLPEFSVCLRSGIQLTRRG